MQNVLILKLFASMSIPRASKYADLCMRQQPNNGQKDCTTPFEGTVKVANWSKDACLYAQRTRENELAQAVTTSQVGYSSPYREAKQVKTSTRTKRNILEK